MVNKTYIIIGSTFCFLAIILGAFGAHSLKEILTPDRLQSFETGVRYQMYSGLSLLLIALIGQYFQINVKSPLLLLSIGTVFFSLSIYGLTLQDSLPFGVKFLGPITPIGGLLMLIGWILFIVNVAKA